MQSFSSISHALIILLSIIALSYYFTSMYFVTSSKRRFLTLEDNLALVLITLNASD